MAVPRARTLLKLGGGALAVAAVAAASLTWIVPEAVELLVSSDTKHLRDQPESRPRPGEPTLLVLAIDGVDRALLYQMLRDGELPRLERLLGGRHGRAFPHAHLDETALAPMPTSTLASWATIFTGAPPGHHGVAGNEYFVRTTRTMAVPAGVSMNEPDLVVKTYTDGYANDLLGVPTVYEAMRLADPDISIWVCMSQFFRGADRLLTADRTVLFEAFEAFVDDDDDDDDLELFADLDREVVENLIEELDDDGAPRVLTLYLAGPDAFAHGSDEGPDAARRRYLRDVFDELMGQVGDALARQRSLDDRTIVVVSDHGHTAVRHDAAHALGTEPQDDPPAVVAAAGYRLRPFEVEVDRDTPYDAVLAYGGAVAYVYLADRTTCGAGGCDWTVAPRFEQDVVPMAEALLAATTHGTHAPSMRGSLELILVRRPGSGLRGPFDVYLGGGRTESLERHLEAHPRAGYVDAVHRIGELGEGPRGDHAGDILLITRSTSDVPLDRRFYFSSRYHSWHGGPGRQDSEIPLIVANPGRSAAELERLTREVVGPRADAHEIAPLLHRLLRAN